MHLSNSVFYALEDPWYGKSKNILHSFIPMGSEVNILPFLEDWVIGQRLLVTPKTLPGGKMEHYITWYPIELEDGMFGTRHVKTGEKYDGRYQLIFVPGLAFSPDGHRLGYGHGYYDRFLREHPEAIKIGIGFPFQLLDELPVEPHDIRMDALVMGDQRIDLRT